MKKLLLVMAALFCVATASAKGGNAFSNAKWSLGLRAGYGVQAQTECFLNNSNYLEARLGLYGGACADFTALYNWHLKDFDWTPSVGKWYLDAGVGANVGGAAHFVFGGVAGQAKLGLKFNKVPIRLALDWTPVLGLYGWYGFGGDLGDSENVRNVGFYGMGWANVGVSATWCF